MSLTFTEAAILTLETLADKLNTSLDFGLTSSQVSLRLSEVGLNRIHEKKFHWWFILVRQLLSSFIYLLIAAALLALLLGERWDAAFILIFIGLNTTIGFYQEYRSEQTAFLLRRLIRPKSRLRRDNREQEIYSENLVPGDLLLLEPGDIIAADVRWIKLNNLNLDESVLTGESVPVAKVVKPLSSPPRQFHQAENIGFAGTTVVAGYAEGLVIATGNHTALGQIAKVSLETERVSSFTLGINQISRFILWLVIITLGLVVIAHYLLRPAPNLVELTLFAIALAVSVIPEALPVVTTFSLSRGALRLARHKVVVKRLSAVEDLGGIEILCTDKTGTLTENRLTVADIYGPKPDSTLETALVSAYMLAHQKAPEIDPFDRAVWHQATTIQRQRCQNYQLKNLTPFDPRRRLSSVEVKLDNKLLVIIRGAPETLVSHSTLSPTKRKQLITWLDHQGTLGRRVLAYAQSLRNAHSSPLTFVGCISFVDPIKKTASIAINNARELGLTIKILTGDHPEVATAVARTVGLVPQTSPTPVVITGDAFDHLSDQAKLQAVTNYQVFARVSPQQKYAIIKLLQTRYQVGFLGEGINDAPALKIANVAIVVDHAADIARDTADIILLKKSLAVIIDGIKEGREVFANTVKYIKATLSANIGNFIAIAVASLFVNYLPLLPLQILLVNLLSDFPMIAIATDTVDPGELHSPRHYHLSDIALIALALGLVSSVFDFLFFGLFFRQGPTILRTYWFIGSILTELVLIFSIRTRRFLFKAKPASYPIWILTGLAALATLALPQSRFGQTVFDFTPLSPPFLTLALSLVVAYFIATETVKLLFFTIRSHR